MTVSTDILERITKLLRLASDKGATEAEAATAMEMAHKLLSSHNLDMDQVEQHNVTKVGASKPGRVDHAVNKWDVALFTYVVESNYCKVLRLRRYNLVVIGRPDNVKVAIAMFAWIKEQAERFWMEEWAKDPRRAVMNWRTHKAGFYRGFSIRLYRRLHDAMKGEDKVVQTMAMVRVDENAIAVQEIFGKVRKGAKNDRSYDQRAVSAGYARGGDAQLVKMGQLGQGG